MPNFKSKQILFSFLSLSHFTYIASHPLFVISHFGAINNAIFLLNHMLTNCITVYLGNIVLKCKYRVRIDQLFDRKS